MGFLGSNPCGTTWLPRKARPSGKITLADSSWNSTVRSSIFFVLPGARPESEAAADFGSLGSTMRSKEYTTSSAVTGLPSCHSMPSFSLTCQTEPSALGSIVSAIWLMTWAPGRTW